MFVKQTNSSFRYTRVRVFALTGHNSKLILVGQIGRKKVARERGCKSTELIEAGYKDWFVRSH